MRIKDYVLDCTDSRFSIHKYTSPQVRDKKIKKKHKNSGVNLKAFNS